MTDQELVELFLARSDRAVPALAEQYGPYCRAVAARLLADGRDVEECLNDCWLAVWRAIPPAAPEHFKGWLAACLPLGDDALGKLQARELGEAISRFLRVQKPDRRAAFLRRYWYAQSVEQVAQAMGWSASKTKTVLFRLRGSLWEYLSKEGHL